METQKTIDVIQDLLDSHSELMEGIAHIVVDYGLLNTCRINGESAIKELKEEQQSFGSHLYSVVSRACKACGTYDPEELMPYFEEEVTNEEYDKSYAFLKWCYDENKPFGHSNYEEVYAEFRNSLG